MTKIEMVNKVTAIFEKLEEDYETWEFGLRFEDKEYNIGDSVGNSKHNADREDEREFPEYGTEEYEEMEELPGTSAWSNQDVKSRFYTFISKDEDDAQEGITTKHAYIIVGDGASYDHDELVLDDGEILIENAEVYAKLF